MYEDERKFDDVEHVSCSLDVTLHYHEEEGDLQTKGYRCDIKTASSLGTKALGSFEKIEFMPVEVLGNVSDRHGSYTKPLTFKFSSPAAGELGTCEEKTMENGKSLLCYNREIMDFLRGR